MTVVRYDHIPHYNYPSVSFQPVQNNKPKVSIALVYAENFFLELGSGYFFAIICGYGLVSLS